MVAAIGSKTGTSAIDSISESGDGKPPVAVEAKSPAATSGRDLKIHAPRPAAKDVREVSHFQEVKNIEDLANHPFKDVSGARRILKRFRIGDGSANFAYRNEPDCNYLSVFTGDAKCASRNGFRTLLGSGFGLANLFAGLNTRAGASYLSEGSVIDMVDQKQVKQTLSQLRKGIASGEYKVVFNYKEEDGKFGREPKSIAILRDYGMMLKNLRENPPAGMPKEFATKFLEQIDKLAGDKDLQHMYACSTILVNPKYKDAMSEDENINSLCQMVAECMPAQATVIFPRNLFGGAAETASKTREYTAMDWKHVENKDGKFEFNQHPITFVRPKADGKKPISPAFVALHQMHTMMQIGDPSKLDPESIPKLMEAQEFNAKAIKDYDEAVTPKAETKPADAELTSGEAAASKESTRAGEQLAQAA